jgi:hypothetical protein
LSVDNEVSLAWLAEALRRLRPEGQKKVVGYLEAVLEEVVFETKMVPGAYPRSVTYPTEGV